MSRSRASGVLTDAYSILIRPLQSEKTWDMMAPSKEPGKEQKARYAFEVHPKATKPQIRRAIEQAFGVTVDSVCTMIVKPRRKAFRMKRGGSVGFTRTRKKAIVRLAEGSKTIDLI